MKLLFNHVISGGQIGADIAGLRAAKEYGISTGGWVPKDCRTLDGPNWDLIRIYGCRESSRSDYPWRTRANVALCDGTLRFAYDFNTPGEICTLHALEKYRRPYLDIDPLNNKLKPANIVDWLVKHKITILNIAGNASAEIEAFTYKFLCDVFRLVKI